MKRYIIAKSGSSTYYCDDKEKIILEQEETDEANEYSRSFTGEFHCEINILSKFVTFDDSYDTDVEPEVFKTYREHERIIEILKQEQIEKNKR